MITKRLRAAEEIDGCLRPHRPLPEQATVEPTHDGLATHDDGEWGDQVGDDAIVVAGVKGDVRSSALDHGAHDVDGRVSIERRDLDRPDAGNLGEGPPERVAERSSSHRRLQVEAEEWNHVSDPH